MLDHYTSELRKQHVGSSDAAAILGVDPWRSAYDVWADKTGRLRQQGAPGPALTLGNYLEPAVLAWCEDQLRTTLTRSVFRVGTTPMAANFDALAFGLAEPAVVEAKTVGLISRPGYFSEFGGAGTDELPDHIVIQVQHQLAVAAAQGDWPAITVAHVPTLLAGVGFVLYRVERDAELIDVLVEAEARFWRDYVVADVPPPDAVPTTDTIKRLIRTPERAVEVPVQLAQTWLDARAAAKQAQADADQAQRRLLAALGDAEVGTCALGTVTYREQSRAEHVVPAGTFRVARWKATRAEKGAA